MKRRNRHLKGIDWHASVGQRSRIGANLPQRSYKDGFGLADDGAAAGINSGADDEQTGRNPKVRVADHTSVVRGGPNSAKVFPRFCG
jgi:hypothetical protein